MPMKLGAGDGDRTRNQRLGKPLLSHSSTPAREDDQITSLGMADVLPLNYSRSLLSINAKQKTDCRDSIRFSGTGTSPTLVESSSTGTSFMGTGGVLP